MKLYFNPLACSLASRIAIYEANLEVEMIEVNNVTKRTRDDRDYRAIYPLGLVPLLELPDGTLLSENAAVLQYLSGVQGDRALQQWLSFVGSELHRWLSVLLDKKAPADVRAYAVAKVVPKLEYADQHLANREYLLGEYSAADGYMFVVLNWTTVVAELKLASYPNLKAFHTRMLGRLATKRAFEEERTLYMAEAKHAH